MKELFQKRLEIIRGYLFDHLGQEITFEDLRVALEDHPGHDATDSVTNHQLLYCVKRLRNLLPEPSFLQILAKSRVVLRARETVYEKRERHNTAIKSALGHVACNFLFGKLSRPEECVRYLYPADWPDTTRQKLAKLRRKAAATILVDSGSTTRAFVKALIDSVTMPLEVFAGPQPSSDKTPPDRLARSFLPTIITNSPRVAVDVLESKHVDKFDVRLIGGTIRGQYGSVAGEYAESCLDSWGYVGGVVGFDVAVLGATGVREDWGGKRAFGVEHLLEASAKSRFLSASNFRCLVMDSEKLLGTDVACVFSAMSGEQVDAVFTDNYNTESANLFCAEASANGILPIVALCKDAAFPKVMNQKEFHIEMREWNTHKK